MLIISKLFPHYKIPITTHQNCKQSYKIKARSLSIIIIFTNNHYTQIEKFAESRSGETNVNGIDQAIKDTNIDSIHEVG